MSTRTCRDPLVCVAAQPCTTISNNGGSKSAYENTLPVDCRVSLQVPSTGCDGYTYETNSAKNHATEQGQKLPVVTKDSQKPFFTIHFFASSLCLQPKVSTYIMPRASPEMNRASVWFCIVEWSYDKWPRLAASFTRLCSPFGRRDFGTGFLSKRHFSRQTWKKIGVIGLVDEFSALTTGAQAYRIAPLLHTANAGRNPRFRKGGQAQR